MGFLFPRANNNNIIIYYIILYTRLDYTLYYTLYLVHKQRMNK